MASIVVAGDTSGTVTLAAPAVAGTTTLTLPTTTGTVVASNSATTLNSGASAMTLQTNGTTAVTIDTSQNVGIGTTSPAQKLDVYGYVKSSNASGNAAYFFGTTGNTYYYSDGSVIATYTGGSERMRIDSSGNLLVGTTTLYGKVTSEAPGANATESPFSANVTSATGVGSCNVLRSLRGGTQVGSITNTSTATAYNTSSDYRLKDNIVPMVGALNTVAQLNPVTYKWKVDGSDGQGFIAHELQEVAPDCVSGTKDAVDAEGKPVYQGVDTSFLVATLTAAIQELKAELDELKAKVNV
jgi:hypothetical protein